MLTSVIVMTFGFLSLPGCVSNSEARQPAPAYALSEQLPAWAPGYMDIHHIQTGRENSTFVVLSNGMTMLVDAGAPPDDWGASYKSLKLAPAVQLAGVD